MKGGNELTEFIERISGSIQMKDQYDEVEHNNAETESITFKLAKQIGELKKEKKRLEQMAGYMDDC